MQSPQPTRRPHIRDVAALARVSVATVSRIINDSGRVSDATRKRVEAAIAATGYVPLASARALSRQESGDLTIVTPDPEDYGYTREITGAMEICAQYSTGLNVRPLIAGAGALVSGQTSVKELLALGAGPMIILDSLPPAELITQEVLPLISFVPVVRSYQHAQELLEVNQQLRPIWIDEREGMRMATEHLLALGHRNIAHVAVPRWKDSERDAGWSDAMENAGLPQSGIFFADWEAESGYAVTDKVLASGSYTAISCGSDALALGVIRRLTELGLRVPEDISVMGFDGRPYARLVVPSLSTVHLDFFGLGRAAARLAFDPDLTADEALTEVKPLTVLARESTSSPSK